MRISDWSSDVCSSDLTITAYASIFLSPICLVAAIPHWTWPGVEQLAWLAGIGIVGTVAQTVMNQSFKLADASAVLPIDFSKLLWASALGFAMFGAVPDRSEERRVGQECVSPCRSRWSPE